MAGPTNPLPADDPEPEEEQPEVPKVPDVQEPIKPKDEPGGGPPG